MARSGTVPVLAGRKQHLDAWKRLAEMSWLAAVLLLPSVPARRLSQHRFVLQLWLLLAMTYSLLQAGFHF